MSQQFFVKWDYETEDENPDLVILDVMATRDDGPNLHRSIRHNPSTQDMPVIVVTSRAQDA